MNTKMYAIIGIIFALAFCCLAFMPAEEADALDTATDNVGAVDSGSSVSSTYTFSAGRWNDTLDSISAPSTDRTNCTISNLQAIRSGEAYNWQWTISYTIKPTNWGSFSAKIYMTTKGGFLQGNDQYELTVVGYAPYKFWVNYESTGGVPDSIPSTTATATTSTTSITISSVVPERTNYNFLGWSTSSSAVTASYLPGGTYTFSAGNTNLYPVWEYVAPTPQTYTVTVAPYLSNQGSVNVSGGGSSSSSSITVNPGTSVTFTTTPASGYVFKFWRVIYGSSPAQTYYSQTLTLSATNDLDAVAYYDPVGFYIYIQSDNPSYGSVSSSSLKIGTETFISVSSMNNLKVTNVQNQGTVYVSPTPATPTAQYRYVFDGWFDSNGNPVPLEGDTSLDYTSSHTITAKFHREIRTYTVTIQPNDESLGTVNVSEIQNVPYGTAITSSGNILTVGSTTVTATPTPDTATDDYQFVSWTNGSGTVTGATTITANFSKSTALYAVSIQANDPSYGSIQPIPGINVPYGTEVEVYGSSLVINNVEFTAVANASDGNYSYSFDSWDVEDGDLITEDTTITATFTRAAISHVTHWSNNMVNGAVSFVFDWPSENTEIHNMSMALWSGAVNPDFTTTWTDTGYVLNISASYPNTNFAFDLQLNGTSVKSDTVTVGKWSTYELIIDATNGQVIMTPTATFSDFMTYTTLDSQRTVVFDFSDIKKNTAIQVIDHEDTGLGDHVRFSVTNTSVFLNTYGVVMNNPTINLYNHFPQYDKLRANFYGFALYGQSMTVNNTTYTVQNGAVSVSYATNGAGDKVLPSLAPDKPVETRTLALNNVSVTWDGSHCYLTFESDRFTIDLGAYQQGNELVSFAGLWYFTSVLYEPSTTTAKELGEWKMLPDLSWNQMLIIFLGVIVLAGAALYIRLNGSFLDLLLIGGAAVTAFILIW